MASWQERQEAALRATGCTWRGAYSQGHEQGWRDCAAELEPAMSAAFQVLSGHHEALGHDWEIGGKEGDPCVGCDAIAGIRAALDAMKETT